MYRRYQPGPAMQPPKQGKPPAGEMGAVRGNRNPGGKPSGSTAGIQKKPSAKETCRKEKKAAEKRPLFSGLIPPALYNGETKKILGMFTPEDLLLAALIFLLWDSDEPEDSILVYLLLYVLLSDYVDFPFDFGK